MPRSAATSQTDGPNVGAHPVPSHPFVCSGVKTSITKKEALLLEHAEILSEAHLFRTLPRADLLNLARATQTVTVEPGEYLLHQDDPGESVFFIASGRLQVIARIEADGLVTEAVVCVLGKGDTVGELSLLDGRPRSASCLALTPVSCVKLEREEFLDLLRNHWQLTRTLLEVLAERLRAADGRLAEYARDSVTGLYCRRALRDLYEREVARVQFDEGRVPAQMQPMGVVYVDVDQFKQINDRYGHQKGDDVLKAVARALTSVCRTSDIVARLGGDEFVAVLPNAGLRGVRAVERRLTAALAAEYVWSVPFTVSVGSCLVDLTQAGSLEEALDRADAAMYRQKANRRAS